MDTLKHRWNVTTRREFFTRAGSGLAGIALANMLAEQGAASVTASGADPLAPKSPHHAPRAKSVIWLFMEGGPSHVDLFDPKPLLQKLDGQPIPGFDREAQTDRQRHRKQHPDGIQADLEAVRAERHVGLRLVSEHRRTRRRHDGHPLLLGGRPQSRRLGLPDEHRLDSGRPSVDRRLGHVWAGQRQPQPAFVRGADRRQRSDRRRQELELRIPARDLIRARSSGGARRRSSTSEAAGRKDRRSSSATSSGCCRN